MKNYIERTNALLKRRDEYLAAQKARRAKIIKISSVACSFVAVCLIGVSIWQSDLLKPKDTGSDLPEGFVQVQPNDYIPEQSQPKPDTNTQINEPDLSSPEDKPAVKPDNNTDTEIKQPDVSLEAITPPIVGDMTQNFSPAINYKPLEFEIDDDFSPYEIKITLTPEESIKDIEYTIEDFPELDIYNIFEFTDYQLIRYYEELKNCRSLLVYINEPSKERVLEYCKLLEKDERVQFARPNVLPYVNSRFADKSGLSFIVEVADDISFVRASDFIENDVFYIYSPAGRQDDVLAIKYDHYYFKNKRVIMLVCNKNSKVEGYVEEQLKILLSNKIVKSARPMYFEWYFNEIKVTLSEEGCEIGENISPLHFPELELEKVIYSPRSGKKNFAYLYPSSKDEKIIVDYVKMLKQNKYVIDVNVIGAPETIETTTDNPEDKDFLDERLNVGYLKRYRREIEVKE